MSRHATTMGLACKQEKISREKRWNLFGDFVLFFFFGWGAHSGGTSPVSKGTPGLAAAFGKGELGSVLIFWRVEAAC